VLFVDDEQRVLDGLRRMLRPMRHEWDMSFVSSGQQALAAIADQPISILITDMRMPGMDGSRLLELVAKRSPETVRIVLSGQSDRETIYRSMNKAHQYLSKPCDADTLRRVIDRACKLRDTLADENLKQVVASLSTLPSPPKVYSDLLAALQQEAPSLQRIGEIIATDVSMTAKVLQLANSAWFALNRSIDEPADAVLVLGTETIKTLVLSAHVFAQLESDCNETSEFVRSVCAHSVRVAHLARSIALLEGADRTTANFAFMAGMMHEVGLLVMAVDAPESTAKTLEHARSEGISLMDAERSLLPATHAQVGAYLLGLWGLPNPILEAVAFIDDPGLAAPSGFSALAAVHVADALLHAQPDAPTPAHPVQLEFLEAANLTHRLPAWTALLDDSEPVGSAGDPPAPPPDTAPAKVG